MAGRGQHFIPRHFMKPFVIPDGSNKLWMYRRGAEHPIPVDRGDAAKQRDFYSKPSKAGTPSLDDLITDYEDRIVTLVDELRALPIGSAPSPEKVAEVAAHLSIRSAHTRTIILEGARSLAKALTGLVEDPSSFFGLKRLPSNKPPTKIEELIFESEAVKDFSEISGVSVQTLARIAYFSLRERGSNMLSETRDNLIPLLGPLNFSPKKIAAAAHVEALSNSLAPELRVKKLSRLNWVIIENASKSAILPDCVCITYSSDGWEPLFQLSGIEPELVVFPLSPAKLIVGSVGKNPSIDLDDYNQAAASTCMEFFLAHERHPELDIWHGGLGDGLRETMDELINLSIKEAADSYVDKPAKPPSFSLPKISVPNSGELSFQLSLRGFGDEPLARSVSNEIQSLILEMLPLASLMHLDGITFAYDYEAALGDVDRGFETETVIKTKSGEHGIGVAMPITVKRDGIVKTHIVMRAYLAEDLISDNKDNKKSAQEIFSGMLAGIVMQKFILDRFPDSALTKIQDPVEGFLYSAAGNIFETYFSSRVTLKDSDYFIAIQEMLIVQIEETCQKIVLHRRLYRTTGDLDGFIGYATSTLDLMLKSLVRVIGILHSRSECAEITEELKVTLEKIDMLEWFELLANDLDAFFCEIDSWANFEDLLFINRHFERWLLYFGILIEGTENDQVYIHVPHGSDAEYLAALK